jgi:putative hydrolase of HD superfamily
MEDFLSTLSKTKMIPRSGWITHGVPMRDVESVADHSFSTTFLALLLADLEIEHGKRVDVERVLRMSLLHDLSETLTFDISKEYLVYLGKQGKDIKDELEDAAWKHILAEIKEPKIRMEYAKLQREFNSEQTLESRIAHDADHLDILLQAVEYAKRGCSKPQLAPLWDVTEKELRRSKLQSAQQLLRAIRSLYQKRLSR